MNELILYTTEDGRSQIKPRADQQTVWLTQVDMAELFDAMLAHSLGICASDNTLKNRPKR